MVKQERVERLLAKLFRRRQDFSVNVVEDGVSTHVYRILNKNEVFYLRIALGEYERCVSSQVLAHTRLLKLKVKVPEIVSWEEFNPLIGHSYMLVREIKGFPLHSKQAQAEDFRSRIPEVLEAAGADIAKVAAVKVSGFGHIDKNIPYLKKLTGEFDSDLEWLWERFAKGVTWLEEEGYPTYSENEKQLYRELLTKFLRTESPILAHGDLAPSHIYAYEGKYSGIIDWGDILCAGRTYDLAHFGSYAPGLVTYLEKGYHAVTPLPDDYQVQFLLTRIAVSIRKLAWISKNQKQLFSDHSFKRVIPADRENMLKLAGK
jgi:aminoglycoside phosphotransferase (APT) family kinase protein